MGVVHPDLEDGWALVAEQRDRLGDLVQFVDAAAPVLIPKEELLVVAQAEGVVQLVTLVDHLWNEGVKIQSLMYTRMHTFTFRTMFSK